MSKNPVFHGSAYHSQDNAFLFYYPQVAGRSAPEDFVTTAKAFSAAFLAMICGREPWESVGVDRRFMSLCGTKPTMRPQSEGLDGRWLGLVGSPERLEKFMKSIELLMKAMTYAMALPLESE